MKNLKTALTMPWIVAVALLGLLVALATLQYRWLGQVSEAQRERERASLARSARFFAEDFDRELVRSFLHFQGLAASRMHEDAPSYLEVRQTWTETAPYAELVGDVLRAEPDGRGRLELARYDDATGELAAFPWPDELADLRQRLEERSRPRPGLPPFAKGQLLDGEVPAVILPLIDPEAPWMRRRGRFRGGPAPGDPPFPGRRERFRFPADGYLIVRLDETALRESVLADLARLHFGKSGGLDYHVAVTDGGESRRVIFEAGPRVRGAGTADATSDLFGLPPREEIRQLMFDMALVTEAEAPEPSGPSDDRFRAMAFEGAGRPFEGRWRLTVTHPAGSLQAAVDAARRRNLAVGGGVLLLLAAAVLLLAAATRRAQETARQQLEFVAGVTHELRTPLAAMRSAGQNLADGVVRESDQVERYGALIEHEGRRLSDMVEQVLEYAGIQSGQRRYRRERISMAEVVEGALADCRTLLDDNGFEVETEVAADVPDVVADREALTRAVGNLIANAVKYGGRGAWIAVRARGAGSEVRLIVEDRGRGIPQDDLPRLFEPFFRGRDQAAGRIPGSGLGLALVQHICEAHGGRITVDSREGEGSAFILHLPAAPAQGESLRAEAVEA